MDIRSVFIFSIFILISVQGQDLNNMLADVIFSADDNNGAVCRMDINNNYSYVYTGFPNWIYPFDIDYDPVDHLIYWMRNNREISSGSLFGNSEKTVRSLDGFAETGGITVDSISRLLFYTDMGNHMIAAIHLEESLHKTVISSGLVNPRAIVADPINGTIYWADSGNPAKIEKSNYDGTNRQELVNTGLSSPYGLAVDINDGVLYWCEIGTFTIERANVDGSNRSLIYQEQEPLSGCSIALYRSYLYFTTWWASRSLMRIGTDGRGLTSVSSSEYIYPIAIHVHINGRLGINGCSNASGGCSHICFPLPGGYKECACPDLMTLQADGKTCRQDDLPDEFIIASDRYGVLHRIDINNNYSYVNLPFPNWLDAYDLDYDRTDGVIYWVNRNNQINSGSIFGMNIKTVRYLNGFAQPYGIAVDSISRLLFYTDLGNRIIAAISLQDYTQKTVISSGLLSPRAIVIDPINGKIYWVDSESPAKIETSNYDGTNRQDVLNTGLLNPYGLDVDINAGVLYWCETGAFTIQRANVDGSNRSLIYQEQVLVSGCSIALYQSYLYFTIWDYRNVIMRIGTDGSGLISVAPCTLINPLGIHVNHNGHLGSNGCSNGSGGCSHFCFPQPSGSNACACPDVMTLQSDGKTCQMDTLPENFLLVIDGSKRSIYRMDIDTYTYVSIPLQIGSYPNVIDYDPNDAVMFWTDLDFRQINSGSIYLNNHKTLRGFNDYAALNGIAVDLISRLLFYTDSGQNIIAVISLDQNVTKTIISDDLNRPHAIVTDSTNGTIYWSSLNKIEKSNYDGTSRQEVVNTGLNAYVDLAVDINVDVMYWCHHNTRKIELANVDGSNRQVLYQDQAAIYKCNIALYQSYLYYIDSSQSFLMRIATDGSGMTYIDSSIFHNVMDIHVHSNSSKIQGINGCSNGRGGCTHFCFPQPSGYKTCDCPDDMTLQPDGLSCGNYTLPETFLLIMDQKGIYLMDIRNFRYVTVALEISTSPYAITYDPINRNVYWTDQRFGQILSLSIDGDIQRTVRQLKRSNHQIEIAVDVLSRLLFYVDGYNQTIAALSLDGPMHKTVISFNNSSPSTIALDPMNGTIYWIIWWNNAKIEKSNYDGTNRQEVINSGLANPTGLTIDIREGVLYWFEYATSMIERANVDGTNRHLIYQEQGAQFYNIALHQSYLYIRGYRQRWSLIRIGTDGSNPVLFGPSQFGYSLDFCIHSNESGSFGSNGCSSRNGGCSHFCFPRPGGLKVCDCPDGLTLQYDGHTCRSYDNECEPSNNCQHICDNLQGSYRCLCYTGFKVDVDNTTKCKPITECSRNETEFCAAKKAQCAIIRGNAVCQCSKGFEWNSEQRDCIDIKDCNHNAKCNQQCIEEIGGYTCACWNGYRLLENNVTCVACGNNTYAAGCTEICQCVRNNAGNETQTCDHVNGTCICKPGWEGRCDRDIDECTRNPQICRGLPNSGCHNTFGGYECSCLRGYVRQGNQCITDGPSATTPAPEVGETVVVMAVKLDVALGNGVNLNVTATYEYFSNAAKVAFGDFYRQRMMDKLKRIEIISLASGSLIIDYNIYIFNTPDVAATLTLTNVELASRASVMFENKSTGILDVRVAGRKVSSKPSDEELCKLYQLTFATCNNGYMCKVTYGLLSCRQVEKDESYLTTALAAGIPIGLLLIGAIIVLICVIKRQARTGRRAQENPSGNLTERTSTTEPVVNRLDTVSTEKTNDQTGIWDDKSTGTPRQISAVGPFSK